MLEFLIQFGADRTDREAQVAGHDVLAFAGQFGRAVGALELGERAGLSVVVDLPFQVIHGIGKNLAVHAAGMQGAAQLGFPRRVLISVASHVPAQIADPLQVDRSQNFSDAIGSCGDEDFVEGQGVDTDVDLGPLELATNPRPPDQFDFALARCTCQFRIDLEATFTDKAAHVVYRIRELHMRHRTTLRIHIRITTEAFHGVVGHTQADVDFARWPHLVVGRTQVRIQPGSGTGFHGETLDDGGCRQGVLGTREIHDSLLNIDLHRPMPAREEGDADLCRVAVDPRLDIVQRVWK